MEKTVGKTADKEPGTRRVQEESSGRDAADETRTDGSRILGERSDGDSQSGTALFAVKNINIPLRRKLEVNEKLNDKKRFCHFLIKQANCT